MRNISDMNVIQIDVTNLCNKSCSNCTRFCGNYTKDRIFFMDLDYYEKAVISLKDFNGVIGMIGGEPTLHPQFLDMCEILKKHIPEKDRRGLWSNTTTPQFNKYKDYIYDTFSCLNLNDHVNTNTMHTPILVASEELNISEDDRERYIDNCWVQMTWSATITPKGGFFCEVAGTLSWLFDGVVGWDIEKEPHWWKKTVDEYKYQRDSMCRQCGCAVPLLPRRSTDEVDDVSPNNLKKLLSIASPKILGGRYILNDGTIDESQRRDCRWYRTY